MVLQVIDTDNKDYHFLRIKNGEHKEYIRDIDGENLQSKGNKVDQLYRWLGGSGDINPQADIFEIIDKNDIQTEEELIVFWYD